MDREHDGGGERQAEQVPNNQMDALIAEMRRMNERLDRMEGNNAPRRQPMRQPIRNPRPRQDDAEEEDDNGRMIVEAHEDRYRRNTNPTNVKIKIPSFQGKSDPEAYLEWEIRLEMVFQYQSYTADKKVKLAIIEFLDYAVIWWD